jgi:uncharacterized membrane protein
LSEAPKAETASEARDRRAEEESDHLHRYVGYTLRAGLVLSTVLLAGGLAARLVSGISDAPAALPWTFEGDLGMVLSSLGVTVLAMTPALRVLALVVLWAKERDWRFVAVALAVVATLSAGVLLKG